MFGLFGKKDPIKKLEKRYQILLKESFDLSKIDRIKSDQKQAEAEAVMDEIVEIQKTTNNN